MLLALFQAGSIPLLAADEGMEIWRAARKGSSFLLMLA
jgi:hypothetical protein